MKTCLNNRLVTSGCSFTEYCWSTWADILGSQFNEYQNVGCAGSDNASIARFAINEARTGDTVIIMWSSFDRWSMYYPNEVFPARGNPNNHWRHRGTFMRDKEFFTKFYHPIERFQTTMDYVQLVDLHSKVHGYTAYHFPAFPWLLGECERTVNPEVQAIFDRTEISNNYLNEISLYDMRIRNKQEFLLSHKYTPNGDKHPTPLTNLDYVREVIAPKLGIDLNNVDFSSIMLEHEDVLNGIVK